VNSAAPSQPGSQGPSQDASQQRAEAVRRARPALWVAAGVLWLEAAAVLVYGVLVLLSMDNVSTGVGIGVGGMLIALGVGLALVGRGVGLARQWARGPAVALQLLQLPIALGFRQSIGWLAAGLFVTAAVVLVAIFLPASTTAFTAGRRLPGDGSGDAGGATPGRGARR
jgi:hypothetical protein